jgi:Tfp pilus assembly PilM family ATPase
MTKRYTALYVSKNTLQLVVLKKGLVKLKLSVADSIKIPPGTVIGIPVVSAKLSGEYKQAQEGLAKGFQEPEALKMSSTFQSAVVDLLKKHNIKQGEVVSTALPPEFIVIRYFQMPRLAPAEHKAAIPFEALKYLPYKLEEIVYAYTISYEKVPADKMAVTFVATEKKSVANYVHFIQNVGLRVGYLEAVPYSLMRLLYYTKGIEAGQSAVLVHLGQDSANINIVKNRVLYLTRNVSFSNKVTPLSQSSFNITEAQQPVDESKFENLLMEIRLSFDYFHRQFPEEKIEKMIIWSNDEKAHNFAQTASKDLNVLTKVSNPFGAISSAENFPVEYAIGCGLALRSLYAFKEDVNLSPAFKKIEVERLLRLTVFEMCLAAVVLFMFYTLNSAKVQVLQNEFNTITKEQVKANIDITKVSSSDIKAIKQEFQRKLDYLRNLTEKKTLLSLKMERVSKLLPKDLWLNEVTYDVPKDRTSQVLTLVGYVNRTKSDDQIKIINQFLDILKADAQFSSGFVSIKLDSISNAKYSGILEVSNFKISCIMDRK